MRRPPCSSQRVTGPLPDRRREAREARGVFLVATPFIGGGGWPYRESRSAEADRDPLALPISHHFSHHLGVTGWTSRLRLGVCFRSVSTARYGRLRSQSTYQGGRRGFEPLLPL